MWHDDKLETILGQRLLELEYFLFHLNNGNFVLDYYLMDRTLDFSKVVESVLRAGAHKSFQYFLKSQLELELLAEYIGTAAQCGHLKICRILIEEYQASVNEGLVYAAYGGHWHLCLYFISKGASHFDQAFMWAHYGDKKDIWRSRKQYKKTDIAARSRACVPSQTRCEEMRSSSVNRTRSTWARGGTSSSASFSIARQ